MPKSVEPAGVTPASIVPVADLECGFETLILRYDSERNALLRTCYSWLNLTLLMSFLWPALVVYADAPLVSVAHTPGNWFMARLAAPAAALVAGALIWRASGVAGYVAAPARLFEMRALGAVWVQALAFIVCLSFALAGVLLASEPTAALKVMLFGLVEAAAVQCVLAGYVKTTLETLGGRASRIFWISAILFGIVFALRGGLAAAIQPDAGVGLIAAAGSAGAVAGVALGISFTYLRDRSASLFPGIVLQWLVVALIPAVVG